MAKCCTRSAEKAFELAGLVGGQNHDQDGDLVLSKRSSRNRTIWNSMTEHEVYLQVDFFGIECGDLLRKFFLW